MSLQFEEIITNQIEIDDDTLQEYLDSCKESNTDPCRDDFLDWVMSTYFISDFTKDECVDIEYDLSDYKFNEYLEEFKKV